MTSLAVFRYFIAWNFLCKILFPNRLQFIWTINCCVRAQKVCWTSNLINMTFNSTFWAEVAPYVTSIALDFTFLTGLFPGVSDNFPPQPAPHLQPFEPVRPFYTTSKSFYEATTTQPPPPPPQSPIVIQHRSSYNHDFKCGIPQYRPPAAAGLVVGGQVVNRGQFPW